MEQSRKCKECQERRRRLRVRDTYMKDYGFADEEIKAIRQFSAVAKGVELDGLLESARRANHSIAPELFFSLSAAVGYTRLAAVCEIPYKADDFDAYKRKVLSNYAKWLDGKGINWRAGDHV